MARLNNSGNGKRRAFVVLGAGIAFAGCAAAWLWQSDNHEETPPHPAPVSTAKSPARFGPGIWTAEAVSANGSVGATIQPQQRPNVAADGTLIVDQTLHQDIDFFLLGGLPGDRTMHLAQLRAYLKRALPPVAGTEALQIADRYLLYMNLHDDLLTRQALPQWEDMPTPAEAERITNWVMQRSRLRQTVLGVDVAQAWFANEESEIRAGLAEFESNSTLAMAIPGDPQPQVEDETANNGRMTRMREASREVRREQFLRTLLEQASKSYVVLERERQADASRGRSTSS